MNRKLVLLASILALVALLLAACGSAATPTPAPTIAPATVQSKPTNAPKSSNAGLETKSNEGGGVTVDVTPTALEIGQPSAFEIVMNTHTVELDDDMTQIAILRDDAGKEYKPTAWEGQEPGGHHRGGMLKFASLTSKPRYVELVIKGLAKVPERVFRWDLP